jgi:hypothetical protein
VSTVRGQAQKGLNDYDTTNKEWGLSLATSGDRYLATTGDLLMATDNFMGVLQLSSFLD